MSESWCILDDFFPNPLSGFRVAEYNAYLRASETLTIYSNHRKFSALHAEYAKLYPEFSRRVRSLTMSEIAEHCFAYINFLNNADMFLPIIEYFKIPFVLTMYPGGGFGLSEDASDAKLARVAASPWLRCIIATQRVTEQYLSQRCPGVSVKSIYGGVFNESYFSPQHIQALANRRRYCKGKEYLDICFVADKYMPQGINKGYPLFVMAIAEIADRLPNAKFHVIGGFTPDDIPISSGSDRWQFHGHVYTDRLRELLLGMDLIVSPNLPFQLHPGNFDGFPTGSCGEASLCGVAVMATDILNLNQHYVDGDSIALIPPGAKQIADRILALASNPQALSRMGERGCQISQTIFSPQRQIESRMKVLSEMAVGSDLGFLSSTV